MPPARILVIDDEAAARVSIALHLRDAGHRVFEADAAEKGLALVEEEAPAVVVSDIRMEGMSGLVLLGRIKQARPATQVILYTAYGSIEDAVQAMRLGAHTYLTKPVNLDELEVAVNAALEKSDLLQERERLRQELRETRRFERLVGSHPAMQEVYKVIAQVAPSMATVLIYGESGTGKELVGEAIHKISGRADGPFVRVNCAVFTQTLLESELFGHEKGAFTGAFARKLGRFETAHKGTLFLDDINVMPEATQVKILRFLQEREFERVGGNQTIKVDVRVVAATNTPLEHEVQAGRFREDLYYRLNVIPLKLPPLRDRKADIPLLVRHFVRKYAEKNDKDVAGFDREALDRCLTHDWPGNVRELENVVERGVIMTRGRWVSPRDLPELSGGAGAGAPAAGVSLVGRTLADIEREAIRQTLNAVGGATDKAARMLGVSRRKIQYKLRQYEGVEGEPEPEGEA